VVGATANGAIDLFRVTEAGLVSINGTASSKQTVGLTIQQDNNDDEIFALQSATDVAHAATDYADTDTFFAIRKADGDAGGARLMGLRDSSSANDGAMWLQGYLAENVSTTKSTAGRAIVEVHGYQTSAASVANTVADGNVFGIRTYRGGATVTLGLWDEDGDYWAGGQIDASDGGIQTKLSVANVSNPPTDAELDAAFGTPATVGEGFIGLVDDNDAGTTWYIVWTDSNSNWVYTRSYLAS